MTAKLEERNGLDILTMEAMNSTFYIAVSDCKISNWKEVIFGWINYVDREWSRFNSDNELGMVNKLPIGETMALSPPLFDVLDKAGFYREKSTGLFSPYLLPQLEYHGYQHSFPFTTSKKVNTGMPNVYNEEGSPFQFHSFTRTIKRISEGKIDLGGIGKGYTVQAAANWLKHFGNSTSGIVDGGGDLTVWSNGQKEWRIGVSHPYKHNLEIAQFRLKNASIATSNVIFRSWTQGNQKKHHVLNGRTGLPVESNIIQATAITGNCLDAEVAAKLCLMVESHKVKEQIPVHSLLLITDDGKIINE
ncbi:FAD:protein FMN transferase [Neobacillus niacini]|uniref:FAD:protein FMN transferase n=1 Tax=Neobacillus niacini TaxID=86668 RepID=UPI002FFF995E